MWAKARGRRERGQSTSVKVMTWRSKTQSPLSEVYTQTHRHRQCVLSHKTESWWRQVSTCVFSCWDKFKCSLLARRERLKTKRERLVCSREQHYLVMICSQSRRESRKAALFETWTFQFNTQTFTILTLTSALTAHRQFRLQFVTAQFFAHGHPWTAAGGNVTKLLIPAY